MHAMYRYIINLGIKEQLDAWCFKINNERSAREGEQGRQIVSQSLRFVEDEASITYTKIKGKFPAFST